MSLKKKREWDMDYAWRANMSRERKREWWKKEYRRDNPPRSGGKGDTRGETMTHIFLWVWLKTTFFFELMEKWVSFVRKDPSRKSLHLYMECPPGGLPFLYTPSLPRASIFHPNAIFPEDFREQNNIFKKKENHLKGNNYYILLLMKNDNNNSSV